MTRNLVVYLLISLSASALATRSPNRRDSSGGLKPVTIPLQDYFNGTDLQWFGPISVGTPPQNFTVAFDTGSFDFLLCGINCTDCINQKRFDGSQSTTFVDLGDGQFFQFATCVDVQPVDGESCVVVTEEVADTISLGSLTASNITFQAITNQTDSFAADPFDGILGLGATAGSFFQSLIDQGLPPLFSFYLTPKSVGNAELTLGGIDNTKFSGPLTFANLVSSDGDWNLIASALSVNGQSIPSNIIPANQSFTFDTGTPNLVFSTNLTEAIYSIISSNIKPYPPEPGAYGIPCSELPYLNSVIDFAFTSTEGSAFNLSIPSSELSVGPFRTNASLCQTLINARDFGLFFIGGSLLKHYYSTWDIGNAKLGFAKL